MTARDETKISVFITQPTQIMAHISGWAPMREAGLSRHREWA